MIQIFIGLMSLLRQGWLTPAKLIAPIPDDLIVKNQGIAERQEQVLAVHTLDLGNRDSNEFVNQVFKHNILLALSFLQDNSFILQPGDVFAFHKNILPEFKDKKIISINSEFSSFEGYQSPGTIYGDGVCQLASLMNWAASDAGLKVEANVNHQFRAIPNIPEQYGTSIRYIKSDPNSQNQNLYIENNLSFPVAFNFIINNNLLTLKVIRL